MSVLQNPASPFIVWSYLATYGVILGYGGYLLWQR
jgi:hypothetical protein